VSPRFFKRFLVAAAGMSVALLATACSSPATTKEVVIKPTTNKGLCKLVSPSVIATVLNSNMNYPLTLIHDSMTECEYLAKNGTSTATILRYDTDSSVSTFAKSKKEFEHRGLELGSVAGLGDQAYYFYQPAAKANLTTVVLRRGSLQLLATGTANLDQIGSIARYALNQFESMHSPGVHSSG
jgi:hypothetical protein